MGYIVFGILLVTAIIAFKKNMWLLFIFCCLLMLLGIIALGHLLMFADGFGSKIPITEAS